MHQSFGQDLFKGCVPALVIIGLFVAALIGVAFTIGYYMGKP